MKVSIIVPVYNTERFLEDCINSILSQDFQDFELLLIDDGSLDDSGKICDTYAAKTDKIKVFHVKNGGPSAARNIGLEYAEGEYIQFVDSDDCVTKQGGSSLAQIALTDSADLIIGSAQIVDENRKIQENISVGPDRYLSSCMLIKSMTIATKAQYLHYVWNKWYKTEIIRKNGLKFDTKFNLGEDFIFNCAFMKNCMSVYLMESIMYRYFRRDNESLSQKFRSNELQRRRAMDSTCIDLYEYFSLKESNINTISAMIGAITLASLESVGSKGCGMDCQRKKEFVNGFLNSEYYRYLKLYNDDRCYLSKAARMKLWALIHKKAYLFVRMLEIRNWLKGIRA